MHDDDDSFEEPSNTIARQSERIDFLTGILVDLGFDPLELLEATATPA